MEGTPSPDTPERRRTPRGGDRGTRRDAAGDPSRNLSNPEAALGGADSVEKTSYVTGKGTDPNARADGPIARVKSGGGISMGAIVLIVVLVAIALLYGGSLFR